ncbi:MAG: MCE family protein [Haloechinothrix sp.]
MSTVLRSAALLVAVALLGGCGIALQNAPNGRDVDGPSYELIVEFADVAGLPTGGKVRLGPATVGRVVSMAAKDFHAEVLVRIRQDVALPKGTRAGLELSTALGDQFIALKSPQDPSDDMLVDGDRIPLADTIRGPDIEDSMALLSHVLNNSGIAQARTVITELNTMLGGREQKARELLGRADQVLASLDERTDEFNRTLRAVNELGSTVNANTDVLADALREIRPAVDVLRSEQGNFDTLLNGVTRLSADVNDALSTSRSTLTSSLTKIAPVLEDLEGVDHDLGALLTNMREFQPLFARAVPGDYVQLDAILNVPDSLAGVLRNGTDLLPQGSGGSTPAARSGGVEQLLRGGIR